MTADDTVIICRNKSLAHNAADGKKKVRQRAAAGNGNPAK
jgi:hypothetical protein